jgi:hypothetical protein
MFARGKTCLGDRHRNSLFLDGAKTARNMLFLMGLTEIGRALSDPQLQNLSLATFPLHKRQRRFTLGA